MSRKPAETLTDYLVAAISPALIMLLVGSLVFFLVHILYEGEFPSKLRIASALFVLAAVLIARRKVRPSEKGFQISRQEDRIWPASLVSENLGRSHVDLVELRVLLPVHVDVDKASIHQLGDARLRE